MLTATVSFFNCQTTPVGAVEPADSNRTHNNSRAIVSNYSLNAYNQCQLTASGDSRAAVIDNSTRSNTTTSGYTQLTVGLCNK